MCLMHHFLPEMKVLFAVLILIGSIYGNVEAVDCTYTYEACYRGCSGTCKSIYNCGPDSLHGYSCYVVTYEYNVGLIAGLSVLGFVILVASIGGCVACCVCANRRNQNYAGAGTTVAQQPGYYPPPPPQNYGKGMGPQPPPNYGPGMGPPVQNYGPGMGPPPPNYGPGMVPSPQGYGHPQQHYSSKIHELAPGTGEQPPPQDSGPPPPSGSAVGLGPPGPPIGNEMQTKSKISGSKKSQRGSKPKS